MLPVASPNDTGIWEKASPRPRHRAPVRPQPLSHPPRLPSEATLSRHRARFGSGRRATKYLELFKRLRDENLAADETRAESRLLYLDGSPVLTHYQAPVYDPKTGKVKNGGVSKRGFTQITAPDAGYLPHSAGFDKTGSGWNSVTIVNETGLPLAFSLPPLNASERTTALDLIRDELEEVIGLLGERELRVLTADGGFTKGELRRELRKLGIVENIHPVSHADSDRARANAAKHDKRRYPITGYKWFTNGHRELKCKCGKGTTAKRVTLGPKQTAIVRVEGHCGKCGNITITSGDWRLAQNPSRWVRINPQNPDERPDFLMGNPLTYNDVVASEYGNGRFGRHEGFHGAMATRFQILKQKRWFRRRDQALTELAMTFCVMHSVALEQRRRVRVAQACAPPGQAPLSAA